MHRIGKNTKRRLILGRIGLAAILAATSLGCDAYWAADGPLLALFGVPATWIDTAEVGSTSRTSGPFGTAVIVPLAERVRTSVSGRLNSPGEVMTYEIGAVNAGDLLRIEVEALDPGFDPAVAVFGADLEVIQVNDDRDYFLRDRNPELRFVARRASAECHVVVASSVRSDTAGAFNLIVTRLPGNQVAPPVPQVIYLDFDGGRGVVVGGRTPLDVSAFSGAMIDAAFADATEALIAMTVARVRADFAPYDVYIVSSSEEPEPAEAHSTVYFGSYNPTLLGLADNVDTFNANAVQEAIVFVETFAVFMSQEPTLDEMVNALANVTSHEIGHLLGLHHTHDASGIMDTSATLRQMLRAQTFLRSPLNADTFPVGWQDAPATLLMNVGGDPAAALAAEQRLRARSADPWYEGGPATPVRELLRLGSGCTGD